MPGLFISILLLLLPFTSQKKNAENEEKVMAFINGNWFNGKKFEKKTFYSVNGVLTDQKPLRVDTSVDLNNQFAVPPFGEAHNHSIDNPAGVEGFINVYLKHGIFYIKNPNSIPQSVQMIKDKVNNPRSVDVIYAHGGLTATGGHPERLYRSLLPQYGFLFPGWTNDSLLNRAYYRIDDSEDIEKKWPEIISYQPDFIKTYLLYSEEYEKRKSDTAYYGRKGLNPEVLKAIVKKAKQHNLRVTTHVETGYDFLQAVSAGVNEVNHLPGYNIAWHMGYSEKKYELSEEAVQLAAKNKMSVVATYSLTSQIASSRRLTDEQVNTQKELQKRNLLLLKKHHVPVTIGCDSYMETSRKEVMYMHSLGIFSNLELLKMWCEYTPAAIFPERKIGKLSNGYEASFLLLKNNPLENFEHTREIVMRVKQGILLTVK